LRSRKTLDAVERNFILIGEAAGQVPGQIRESFPTIPWRDMSDMRNYVVHQYWGVEAQRIWQTIHHELPPLIAVLKEMLDESSEQLPGQEPSAQ
jgi:uncharacterized protein with HEPN domain